MLSGAVPVLLVLVTALTSKRREIGMEVHPGGGALTWVSNLSADVVELSLVESKR